MFSLSWRQWRNIEQGRKMTTECRPLVSSECSATYLYHCYILQWTLVICRLSHVTLHPGNVRANCSIKGPLYPPVQCWCCREMQCAAVWPCSLSANVISNQLAQYFLFREPSTINHIDQSPQLLKLSENVGKVFIMQIPAGRAAVPPSAPVLNSLRLTPTPNPTPDICNLFYET